MLGLNLMFIFFSIFLVMSSWLVIIIKHPIFSLLFLITSFLLGGLLLLLLECEFLALLFVVIYVGAIAILFLFAVMMLESKLNHLLKNSLKYLPISFMLGFFLLIPLLVEISLVFQSNFNFNENFFNYYQNWYNLTDCANDIEIYGQILYLYFVIHFLLAGSIILLALICVVFLTSRFFVKQEKSQSIFKQLARNSKIF